LVSTKRVRPLQKLVTPDSTTRSYLETAYEYIRSIVSPDQDIITAGERHAPLHTIDCVDSGGGS